MGLKNKMDKDYTSPENELLYKRYKKIFLKLYVLMSHAQWNMYKDESGQCQLHILSYSFVTCCFLH